MNGGILRVTGHGEDLAQKAAKMFFNEGNPLWSFGSDVPETGLSNAASFRRNGI